MRKVRTTQCATPSNGWACFYMTDRVAENYRRLAGKGENGR